MISSINNSNSGYFLDHYLILLSQTQLVRSGTIPPAMQCAGSQRAECVLLRANVKWTLLIYYYLNVYFRVGGGLYTNFSASLN